jgi:hypothetical protein
MAVCGLNIIAAVEVLQGWKTSSFSTECRKIIAPYIWTAPAQHCYRWLPVKRNILYFSFRKHKNECTLRDKTNSISCLIPRAHRGNNTLPQGVRLIKCCLSHLLFVLCCVEHEWTCLFDVRKTVCEGIVGCVLRVRLSACTRQSLRFWFVCDKIYY